MSAIRSARALAGICLALTIAWGPSFAAGDTDDFREVLQRLSTRYDFRLWISPGLPPRRVSTDVESLTRDDALDKLLRDISYVLVESDTGELRAVYVLPPGEDPPIGRRIGEWDSAGDLSEALVIDALPEEMQAALLYQTVTNNEAARQSIRAQRAAAIDRLIELVGNDARAQSAGMQQLIEKLEAARDAASQ